MDRFTVRRRMLAASCLAAVSGLVSAGGCSLLPTAMWVFSGINTKADFSGLKGKRVVVVCRPVSTLQFSDSTVARELARQVGAILKREIHKIEIVDQREVIEWADGNDWEEYVEVGKNLHAEMVVGIDLEEFKLKQGQTLYQGKSNMKIMVFDVAKGRDPIFERSLPQATFPPNAATPVSEESEPRFRQRFVVHLAEIVARHFYDHDNTVDFASAALN